MRPKPSKHKIPYRPIPDINVTSLVDVTLVLLIVFMVAAPILKSSLDISVPQAATAKPTQEEGINIFIMKNGKIMIEDNPVDEDNFDIAFGQVYGGSGDQPVFLKADSQVPYQKVLTIVDALREQGVKELGLVAEPSQSRHGRRK